jgi:hypothetical protein
MVDDYVGPWTQVNCVVWVPGDRDCALNDRVFDELIDLGERLDLDFHVSSTTRATMKELMDDDQVVRGMQ